MGSSDAYRSPGDCPARAFIAVSMWVVVAAAGASLRPLDVSGVAFSLVMAGSSLLLLRVSDFPHRSNGLTWSWLGPAIVLLTQYVLGSWESREQSIAVESLIAIRGAGVIGVVIWLFRGFGLIPIAALISALVPGQAVRMRDAARAYPMPRWWLVAVVLLALYAGTAVSVFVVGGGMAGGRP